MADPYAQFEIERTEDFNPDTGRSIVIIFAADDDKLNEIAEYYEQAGLANPIGYGFKTTFKKTAAATLLTVRIPDDILYTESWQFSTFRERVPIWRDEKIRKFNPATTGLVLTDLTQLKSYLFRTALITRGANAIATGAVDPVDIFSVTTPYPGAIDLGAMRDEEVQLMHMIVREGAFTDWKYPVLRRRRYIPNVNLAAKTTMVGRDPLYSLDGIADLFGIPDDRYDQAVTAYDNLPEAALNTKWSWKLGRNDSEGVVGAAKDTECLEWIFGMWSTIKNDFIQ